MRLRKIRSEEVDQNLFNVFCALGYDGASVDMLAGATGLKKASLYHRFPGGKKEMAAHVLNNMLIWLQENIARPAKDRNTKPGIRLQKVIGSIDVIYKGGTSNCLLRALSVGTESATFRSNVSKCFDLLINSFAAIAIDTDIDPVAAKSRAKDVIELIQGSLILSGVSGDAGFFRNALVKIPGILTT